MIVPRLYTLKFFSRELLKVQVIYLNWPSPLAPDEHSCIAYLNLN
jgi:hypothetical protein